MVADERLGPELAKEGVHHAYEIHPDEGGQAAEAAVSAAMDAPNSARRGRQVVLAASAGELGPVASEELVRGRSLGGDREQVCACSLLYKPVFDGEAVTATPDYKILVI